MLTWFSLPFAAELKRECEVALEGALVKQCCSADKILDAVVKNKQQYFANLVQKINTKVRNCVDRRERK